MSHLFSLICSVGELLRRFWMVDVDQMSFDVSSSRNEHWTGETIHDGISSTIVGLRRKEFKYLVLY